VTNAYAGAKTSNWSHAGWLYLLGNFMNRHGLLALLLALFSAFASSPLAAAENSAVSIWKSCAHRQTVMSSP
jgi:hypothetical protein